MLIWINLTLAFLCSFLFGKKEWIPKEAIGVIELQEKIMRENDGSIGIKPSRWIHPTLFGLHIFIIIFFLVVAIASVYQLDLVSESASQSFNVRHRSSTVILSRTEYLLVYSIIFITASSYIFTFILALVRNNVPHTLILTPSQLIIFKRSEEMANISSIEKLLFIEWSRVISVSIAAFDYYTITYESENREVCEYMLDHDMLAVSESRFEKIFTKYNVKVE